MSDQSAKLAGFLMKLRNDVDMSTMRDEFAALFPGITKQEWMRGFEIYDECVLLDAADATGTPIDLPKAMAALGYQAVA